MYVEDNRMSILKVSFMVDKVLVGQILFLTLRFLPANIHSSIALYSSSGSGEIGPIEIAVPRDSISPHSHKRHPLFIKIFVLSVTK
jgi:hypothetical protein